MKFFLTIIILFISLSVAAKNADTTGAVTFLSLAKNLTKYSALNFYHYDVYGFEKRELGGKDFKPGLGLVYFQTSYSYQLLPSLNLAIGHIFQENNPLEDQPEKENRIFQQITYSTLTNWFSMTHRIRLEERFIDKEDGTQFKTRVRYQIGAKRALRGVEIDPGEVYINAYNEFYFSTTGERNALFSDDWTFLGLGYLTKSIGSFEAGPLVQWSRVNQEKDTRTNYTIQAGWIYRIP